jgi:hypothetical protein
VVAASNPSTRGEAGRLKQKTIIWGKICFFT